MIIWGATVFFVRCSVLKSFPSPSRAKYSHYTGIITASAAVSAFNVMRPSDGEQSINM